jgi:hypothetical protein
MKKISPEDRARLSALYNGEIEAMKRHGADLSPASLKAWESAKAALAGFLAELEEHADTPASTDPNPTIGTIADVARWLRAEGYCAAGKDQPVRKSKVYQDRKAGLLACADARAITSTEVMAYVARAGLMQAGVRRADEAEDLNIQKLRYETRKAKADAERREFENARDQGLYLKRQEVELESAIKIGAFDAAFRHMLRITAHDVVALVGGDVKRSDSLCGFYASHIDDLLDEFGRMDALNVTIKRREPAV